MDKVFQALGFNDTEIISGDLAMHSPIDGSILGYVHRTNTLEINQIIRNAKDAFSTWRLVPPPKRGELIRLFGEELRIHKDFLAKLVTLETGKILIEGEGEVQEMIDMCDFATGLSRQLYGLTIASERCYHRIMETWHPLGPVGVITPFNFPVAVWCWNFAIALVCGDSVVWKPSEKTSLTSLAVAKLFEKAVRRFGPAPDFLLQIVVGNSEMGKILAESPELPLISATGGIQMGRAVSVAVAYRFGRCLLELGGNAAMILTPSADIDLAMQAILFSALGTTGQRCTTLRRLIVHESIYLGIVNRLQDIYGQIHIGNPLDPNIIMGPLFDQQSYEAMQIALKKAHEQWGEVFGGERILQDKYPDAFYVRPALVKMTKQTEIVSQEVFAPILYVIPYDNFAEAIRMHNDVPQGLSSCIFTNAIKEAEIFLSASGSDCGIANVNAGTSGAEIGGAFGGEKETGGGRVSGSDTWKNYMRRSTNTINYSYELSLAQGIHFDTR